MAIFLYLSNIICRGLFLTSTVGNSFCLSSSDSVAYAWSPVQNHKCEPLVKVKHLENVDFFGALIMKTEAVSFAPLAPLEKAITSSSSAILIFNSNLRYPKDLETAPHQSGEFLVALQSLFSSNLALPHKPKQTFS